MAFKLQSVGDSNYLACDSADFVIQTEHDVMTLIAACAEHGVSKVILYQDNLSAEFFDLKTTLAGTLLQKLVNYHLRGAAVLAWRQISSERFQELIFECNRGRLFRFFEEKAAAEKWLADQA